MYVCTIKQTIPANREQTTAFAYVWGHVCVSVAVAASVHFLLALTAPNSFRCFNKTALAIKSGNSFRAERYEMPESQNN